MSKLKKIPEFKTEAEERAFWESRDSSDYVDWSQARPGSFSNLKPSTKTISLRLPEMLLDNIFVERLWRTVKYEHLYTQTFDNVKAVRDSLVTWFDWYNRERFHQGLDDLTPDEVYYQYRVIPQAA